MIYSSSIPKPKSPRDDVLQVLGLAHACVGVRMNAGPKVIRPPVFDDVGEHAGGLHP